MNKEYLTEQAIDYNINSSHDSDLELAHEKATRYNLDENNRLFGAELLHYSPPLTADFIRRYNEDFASFHHNNHNNPERSKKYSNVQEAMDHEALGKLHWFGESYDTVKLSALADKFNTTDLTLVHRGLNPEGQTKIKTALSIDVTNSKKGFLNKVADIYYKLQNYPHLVKNELFVDGQTNTVGEKIIPQIVLYDTRDNLDNRMRNWLDPKAGPDLSKNDTTQLKYLAQALFQTAIFLEVCDQKTVAGTKLAIHYQKNLELLKTQLFHKVVYFNKIPRIDSLVEQLAEACELPTKIVKNALCKESDNKNVYLHRLVWGS